jgi:hypothetical protein
MLRRVAFVRSDVSEEPSASFIRVTRIGELGKKPMKDGVFYIVTAVKTSNLTNCYHLEEFLLQHR